MISDRNRIPYKLAYYIQLRYSYAIKVAKLYEISKLIWVPILIGNPPIALRRVQGAETPEI